MATSAAYEQAAERIAGLSRTHQDERSFRVAAIEAIRTAVGFDAYSWILTDPETEVGGSPLAEVPCLPDLPRLIRLKYLTAINRWTDLGPPFVARLQAVTGGRPDRSRLWRELLSTYDVVDVASMALRDRYGCWSFVDLWRIAPAEVFNTNEERFLGDIASELCAAVRSGVARTFEGVGEARPTPGPAVLVLSPDLQVRVQTQETEDYLRRLLPTDADRQPVPAAAYNVAAQLLAREAGIDDHPPTARVHLMGTLWVTFRAARIGSDGSTDADIAVSIEPTPPVERLSLFVRSFGLSGREAELAGHLAAGADTRQMAAAMFLSEHTIQDHLKSVFAKTGTRNRRTLLARLNGS